MVTWRDWMVARCTPDKISISRKYKKFGCGVRKIIR